MVETLVEEIPVATASTESLLELRTTWDPAFVTRERSAVANAKAGKSSDKWSQIPRIDNPGIAQDVANSMAIEFSNGMADEQIGRAARAVQHYNKAYANACRVYTASLVISRLTR